MIEAIVGLIALLAGGALFVGLRKRSPARKRVEPSPQAYHFQAPPVQTLDPAPPPPAPVPMPKPPAVMTLPAPAIVPVVDQVREVAPDYGLTFQGKALEALELMLNSQQSLFITGKAGTGKSTLLRHFVDLKVKKVAVVAPTGIAAINVRWADHPLLLPLSAQTGHTGRSQDATRP